MLNSKHQGSKRRQLYQGTYNKMNERVVNGAGNEETGLINQVNTNSRVIANKI